MLPPIARTLMRWTLLTIAVVCVAFSGLSILATLAAGTLQMDGGYPDGPANLFMSSIAVVRFGGIIPSDSDSKGYELKLLWFLNAFGWEWPQTSWEKSCGIVRSINGFLPEDQLILPEDLGRAANRLRLPQEDYGCLDRYTHRAGICHNEFLAAWDAANPKDTTFSTVIPLFIYYLAVIFLITLALQEVAARWAPGLLKCYCPKFISQRNWCACLKEGEEATPERRSRLRIMGLWILAVTYTIGALMLGWQGLTLVQYVNQVDAQIGGMNARIGSGFIGLSVGTLIAVLLAILCLKLRNLIRKPSSWMEDQIGNEPIVLDAEDIDDEEEGRKANDSPNDS